MARSTSTTPVNTNNFPTTKILLALAVFALLFAAVNRKVSVIVVVLGGSSMQSLL